MFTELEPKSVFEYFEKICSIPHGSRNTSAIADFCVEFATAHNLEYIRDELNNIIIKKPASADKKGSKPIIIQGHLDMVCEKSPDCDIDFEKDGLKLKYETGYIFADKTTLGADDGIAIAYALAILASDDIPHPPIEAVFTVDEEIGMLGATGIDLSSLAGNSVLNIDSECEGILTVSCAGGATVCCSIPIDKENSVGQIYKISIDGLTGGHSGVEIDKGRANADILAGKLISALENIKLISICGGLKDNAIPKIASVKLMCDYNPTNICADIEDIFRKEFPRENIKITVTQCGNNNAEILTNSSLQRVRDFFAVVPNGVQKMSNSIDGLVQTSLNLGILNTNSDCITASFSVRSSVKSEKSELISKLKSISAQFGGYIEVEGDYPAWEYRKDSPLRNLMVDVFKEQYGYEPKIEAIHAGLECGIISEKLTNPDCVSFGPNIPDIHTTSERLDVASVERVWKFILKILELW